MEESSLDMHTEYLKQISENWLCSDEAAAVLNGAKVSNNSTCDIAGKQWQQAIYSDFSGDRNFIVFEIRRKRFMRKTHHNIGFEIKKGSFLPLTKEDLWKEGIP